MVDFPRNLDAFRTNTSNWNTSNVLNHNLQVTGSHYIVTDSNGLPTGPIPTVEGTPLDFRTSQAIGSRWNETVGVCGPGTSSSSQCRVESNRQLTVNARMPGIR